LKCVDVLETIPVSEAEEEDGADFCSSGEPWLKFCRNFGQAMNKSLQGDKTRE